MHGSAARELGLVLELGLELYLDLAWNRHCLKIYVWRKLACMSGYGSMGLAVAGIMWIWSSVCIEMGLELHA